MTFWNRKTLVLAAAAILACALVHSAGYAKNNNGGGNFNKGSQNRNVQQFHSNTSFGNKSFGNKSLTTNTRGNNFRGNNLRVNNNIRVNNYRGNGVRTLSRGSLVGRGGVRLSTRGSFMYHGRSFHRFVGGPYRWPHGYGYTRFVVGGYLPPIFWIPDYYVTDYADYGIDPPPPNFQWVRYGDDLLLIDLNSGQVAQTIYGAYDEGGP